MSQGRGFQVGGGGGLRVGNTRKWEGGGRVGGGVRTDIGTGKSMPTRLSKLPFSKLPFPEAPAILFLRSDLIFRSDPIF